jgi:exopolyphosphatase/guanosine-5'-triphosphate,3'-diphosphate pyrophosphatase
VRLGEGFGRGNELQPAAIDRAVAALRLFAGYAESIGLPKLEVLGTSALRDADNRRKFFDRVAPLNLEISVLSGEHEAGLGALAVANGMEMENAWFVDLGGGSAQVARLEACRAVSGTAYPLGAVRLTERFLSSDPPKRKEVKALEGEVDARLGGVMEEMRESALPIVAVGGTIRNIARAVQREEAYPLGRLHGYFLEVSALEELTERLLTARAKERARIRGIKSDRADIVPAGALVFRRMLRGARADGCWISGHGVREGALSRRFVPPPHLVGNVRQQSIRNLLSYYTQSKSHIEQVRFLASRLFAGLAPLHGLGSREAEILDAAAVLQDLGLAVDFYRHDHHGAYVVAAAQLNGFTHREQALISQLVRYHMKGKPKLGALAPCCDSGDERLLAVLVACLRVADHLDRPRARRVRDVRFKVGKKVVKVEIEAHEEPTLELHGIDAHRTILASAFDRRFEFSYQG